LTGARASTTKPAKTEEPVLPVEAVVAWPLKLLQILDATYTHMCEGIVSVPAAVESYGVPLDTLTKLTALYRDGRWRNNPDAYGETFDTLKLSDPDPATLTMRVLDMFNDVAQRMGRHAPTSLWPQFGVTGDERHLILQIYLPRLGQWAERRCTSDYVAQQLRGE
jgi:hypothetical protein